MLHLGYEKICEVLQAQGKRLAKYRSKLPEGKAGPWRIEKFEVKVDLMNMRMVRDGRGCAPGIYTRLMHKHRGVIMSDTDAEIEDFRYHIIGMRGSVLVVGLGMGCVLQSLLAKPEVKRVTVVEIDADVISLVAPHFKDDRLTIINADAYEWKPRRGERFDYGWYDVWDEICGDNLPLIRKMKQRFLPYVRRAAAWCEAEAMRGR